ncbi:MAG TPA: galactokinase [Dermatophilaceae bacterium]
MTTTTPVVRAFGPGRVNLIGEHTDYNDGLCLPFAIKLGVTVEARESADGDMHARALELGEEDSFALSIPPPADGWRAFVHGIIAELQRAGHPVRAADLTIWGELPRGSGLSSSAALEVALALAMLAHSGLPEPDRRDLAKICSRVENNWVGAQTGLLDQLAALYGRPDHALRLDLRTLDIEPVPLHLAGWQLVTVDSGLRHSHEASGYNQRRSECRQAVTILGLGSLRDATPAHLASLPTPLGRRVRHVIEENLRVEAAVTALREGDLSALARLLDESHASLRDLYEVSVPEVENTVARLKAAGAAGARMVGGGFGGSVLALFPPKVPIPPNATRVSPGESGRLISPKADHV